MGRLIYGRFAPLGIDPISVGQKDGMAVTNSANGLLDQYRVAQPAEIVRLLQQIQLQRKSVLMVLPGGPKVVTMVLDVNPDSGEFIYECGRNRAEKQAVLSADQIQFTTTIDGVAIRFTADAREETIFASAAALRSPLPSEMFRFQRREYYRASVKLSRSYPCTIQLADSTRVSLVVKDISVGGVKLQSHTIAPQVLALGTLLRNAMLDFSELGKLEVTIRVVAHWQSADRQVSNYLYGCQFQHLPKSKEAALQKLVFSLERIHRAETFERMSASLHADRSSS